MVKLDFDSLDKSGLKEAVDGLTSFFGKHAVNVKAGLLPREDACPILVVTPTNGSTVQDMDDVLQKVRVACQNPSKDEEEKAGYTQHLLSAFRSTDGHSDIPSGLVLPASPILADISTCLNGFTTFEAA